MIVTVVSIVATTWAELLIALCLSLVLRPRADGHRRLHPTSGGKPRVTSSNGGRNMAGTPPAVGERVHPYHVSE